MDRVKRLVLVALFSDEDLTDLLVLKGGNALDIAYGIALRSSLDIDFSLPGEFILPLPQIRSKLEACLTSTFAHHDLTVFDVTLEARPKQVKGELAKFWGGYRAHFKVIEHSKYATLSGNVDELRKHAMMLGPNGRFQIEFSRHEYCAEKEIVNVDGTHISVYTPEMLVAEKLRAICQQMSEYARVVKSHPTSRARDFVDIVNLIDAFSIDMTLPAPRA
ncbi:MAG TPA: nucleotidyl transferase AbiEii/AbiGii toxin family protein, partial [Fimbriimonadaceae bacterium]|nr:nucleotidyl transferase AbiEii/AbiGii toxin family protein [Fimbriimonadaceae bacterium]